MSGDADGGGTDVAEFGRYVEMYDRANGPRKPLVDLWERYVAGR